jgi:hypothetical protein
MRNTAVVTGCKPLAVLLQSILGVSAINLLIAFYDIHGGKREVLFFYFVPDITRDDIIITITKYICLLPIVIKCFPNLFESILKVSSKTKSH